MVYAETRSALQTALVNAVWSVSQLLFGTIAGVLADRLDRKTILVATNLLAALVTAILAAVILSGLEPIVLLALVAVFALNAVTTFQMPARSAIVPSLVGRELLSRANGMFVTAAQAADLAGTAVAGVIVAAVGAAWAMAVDAGSFLIAAAAAALAPIRLSSPNAPRTSHTSLLREIRDGWSVVASHPVVRALVWVGILSNFVAIGPVVPALVSEQLHGGAAAYGALEAAGGAGAVAGGIFAGAWERRFGAGAVVIMTMAVSGPLFVGVALSTSLILTSALWAAIALVWAARVVAWSALNQALVADEYRGRVAGLTGALTGIAIPPATLAAGWLADIFGPGPIFAAAGVWALLVTALAWLSAALRNARI